MERAAAATARASFKEPRYAAEELAGIVPADYRKPYDVREIIARVVDDSDFLDFKALYGVHTVCGHAEIEGHAIGIIGNNGPIDADGASKAAHFIQLCCQANMPIVYLQNTTGYMVGREAEQAGIIKHGSKMIQAVANATVPQFTIHFGASFGAGNYGMCGRGFDPRFIFAWPSNRIAVMGGEQAAEVMAIVTEEKLKREGKPVDKAKLEAMEQEHYQARGRRIHRALRHRAALGRRIDRSARHSQSARLLLVDLPRSRTSPAQTQHVRRRADVTGEETSCCLRPSTRNLRRSLQKFIAAEVNPYVDEWEEAGIFPAHDLFKKMGDLGFSA